MQVHVAKTTSPTHTGFLINRAKFEGMSDEEIHDLFNRQPVLVADEDTVCPIPLNCLAIYISLDAIPAMKELCMVADRASTIAEVRQLGWDIFNALDKLRLHAEDH